MVVVVVAELGVKRVTAGTLQGLVVVVWSQPPVSAAAAAEESASSHRMYFMHLDIVLCYVRCEERDFIVFSYCKDQPRAMGSTYYCGGLTKKTNGKEAIVDGFYHEDYEEPLLMLMKRRGVHSALVVKVGISICVHHNLYLSL